MSSVGRAAARLLESFVRWRYAVAAAAFLLVALLGSDDDGDLEFFTQALHVLGRGGSQGGLHLYAVRPDIQIGPLAIAGTGLLDLLCAGRIVFAIVAGALLLLLVLLWQLAGLARDEGLRGRRADVAQLLGGVVLAAAWAQVVPGWGHLDDLAALTALVAALRTARGGRAVPTGVLLAVALGCKPWAGFAVGLLLLLPPSRRGRGLAALVAGALTCWAPFVLAAPATLSRLAHFSLLTGGGSLPYQLGYVDAPGWVRPGQLLLATALIVGCWRLRRFDLVLLCVAVSRLLLDAGIYPYYSAELVLGCLVADVLATGRPRRSWVSLPWVPLSLVSWVGLEAVPHLAAGATQIFLARTTVEVGVLALAVARRPRRTGVVPGAAAQPADTAAPARAVSVAAVGAAGID